MSAYIEKEKRSRVLNNQHLNLLNTYLTQLNIKESLIVANINEISELIIEINSFNDDVAKSNYLNILDTLSQELIHISDEADLLEVLIPRWQALRNNEISNKRIDEFYSELELYILAELIRSFTTSQEISLPQLKKMREIVRRYRKMPNFWQILCKLSGDKIANGYTF